MGMELMDKRGIRLPQKIAPMPGNILGALADSIKDRGTINTWPQIDYSRH